MVLYKVHEPIYEDSGTIAIIRKPIAKLLFLLALKSAPLPLDWELQAISATNLSIVFNQRQGLCLDLYSGAAIL